MNNRNRQNGRSGNRGINTRTALIIVGFLAIYALFQPLINNKLGWRLPGIAQIAEQLQSQESRTRDDTNEIAGTSPKNNDSQDNPQTNGGRLETGHEEDAAAADSPTNSRSSSVQSAEDFLTELPRNRFRSPAGLIYGPGSDEGHRLKHIERHLEDIPNRPGSHGVFAGSMVDFLKKIDQAYLAARGREKGTSVSEDQGAMIYEASFPEAIGYLGGEAGKRQRNPKLQRMRIVVRNGDAVITAFPIR
ncbi:hypothetical protein SH449x_000851 [Pirellulaceae bacterium SH449]